MVARISLSVANISLVTNLHTQGGSISTVREGEGEKETGRWSYAETMLAEDTKYHRNNSLLSSSLSAATPMALALAIKRSE